MFTRLKKIMASFKPNTYHYALLDYLAEELRSNNIKCRKCTSHLAIKLDSIIDDKYDRVIIDCFNGNVYLRGNDARDKKILRLARFGGCRESDAMHCAKGGSKQVIRYIENLIKPKTLEVEATIENKMIDMRNYKIIDLRSYKVAKRDMHKEKTILTDLRSIKISCIDLREIQENKAMRLKKCIRKIAGMSRDYAIAIIDGEVYTGDTHGQAVTRFLEDKDIDLGGYQLYDRYEAIEMFGHNMYSQFVAAHVKDDEIYIDQQSFENITLDQVISILKKDYSDYTIYDYDSREKLAKCQFKTRLKKLSDHDFVNRDMAIVYINGQFIEKDTHAEAISKYLKENKNKGLNEEYYRPKFNRDPDKAFNDKTKEDIELLNSIDVEQLAFAHKVENEDAIYIEEFSLSNIDMNSVAALFKKQYPNYNIYNDDKYDYNEDEYELVAKLLGMKKISGFHDFRNRTSAILYVEGEVFEGIDHYDMITDYMKQKYNLDRNNRDQERDTDRLFDSLEYAMGSKVEEEKTIYIDTETINYVNENTIINTIESSYPGYKVEIETSTKEDMINYYNSK